MTLTSNNDIPFHESTKNTSRFPLTPPFFSQRAKSEKFCIVGRKYIKIIYALDSAHEKCDV